MKRKLLVIRFSSIGDIVLTTPVLRVLREQLRASEIHYLTKSAYSSILASNPNVDKLFTIEKHVKECVVELKRENYDHIVDLHNNLRSAAVKRALGKPASTLNKINFQKWVRVNFKIDRLPDVHLIDRYLKTVECLGVSNDGKGLDYFIPKEDEIAMDSLPPTHRNGYIGFVIGAKHNTKKLPAAKLTSICRLLQKPVILLGGKEDFQMAQAIAGAAGEQVYNACGKYNINQSASLVRQANKIITHDTGLMHIAAAFKKPVISIWGNTIPAFGMYPYLTGHGDKGAGTIMEVKGLRCRPCSKIGFKKCPKTHFRCMEDINEAAIAEAVG